MGFVNASGARAAERRNHAGHPVRQAHVVVAARAQLALPGRQQIRRREPGGSSIALFSALVQAIDDEREQAASASRGEALNRAKVKKVRCEVEFLSSVTFLSCANSRVWRHVACSSFIRPHVIVREELSDHRGALSFSRP